MELDVLDNWIDKFKHFKCYPVRGQCSAAPTPREYKRSELAAFRGDSKQPAPSGRLHAPILLGVKGKVLDVSYGGVENYGASGPYCVLTGIDASRRLATMCLDPNLCESHDISDLDEQKLKTLDAWEARLCSKYPLVGTIVD